MGFTWLNNTWAPMIRSLWFNRLPVKFHMESIDHYIHIDIATLVYHIPLPHSKLLLLYFHSPYMSKSSLFCKSVHETPVIYRCLLFNSCWITFRAWERRELETLAQIALKEQSGHKSSQQTESSCKWKLCWTLQELSGCKQILYVWSLISVSNTYLKCTLWLSEFVGVLP